MTKPLTYRGIPYSITKGPHTRWECMRTPLWHGAVVIPGKPVEEIHDRTTKRETVAIIEQLIDIHFDYEGDGHLYESVERLVQEITTAHLVGLRAARTPTTSEMCSRIGRICERAQHIIKTRYAHSNRAALAERLRNMTEANGCTAAEAATAQEKLRQLEAVS